MPRNNRVAKDLTKFTLRITPDAYKDMQSLSETNGLPMNTLIQKAVDEYREKQLTNTEESLLSKIKSLPLEEQKAMLKKLSIGD